MNVYNYVFSEERISTPLLYQNLLELHQYNSSKLSIITKMLSQLLQFLQSLNINIKIFLY